MPFSIPNDPLAPVNPAAYQLQAQVDAVDTQIIAAAPSGTGVVSGGLVAAQSPEAMAVTVADVQIAILGALSDVAGNLNLGIGASGIAPRLDLVVATAGGVSVLAGAAAPNPDFSALTLDGDGNVTQVVLAAVVVPVGAIEITAAMIIDKRMMLGLYGPGDGSWLQARAI